LSLITIQNLEKDYHLGEILVPALRGVSLEINSGEFVSIMGASGSGKSTLMHIIGCLDRLSRGQYLLDNQDVSKFNDEALSRIRNQKIGFVFQSFNLLNTASAAENVALPLLYGGVSTKERKAVAENLLTKVGLQDRYHHFPTQLSGGQQQRVAIARALSNSPQILLADEPTGDLDSVQSKEIMTMIERLNTEEGLTVIVVTHDASVGERARRIITMQDGKVLREDRK
jgi:putative ABC transport system ATP-binding protein